MISAPGGESSEQGFRWSLRLIGEMRLDGPAGETVSLAGRRERVMLAYLALAPGRKESRINLIGLLWGDRADNTMLDNLRTCLWSLRKSLGDPDHRLVLSEREWIRLDPDALDVDVWRFEELVARGRVRDLEEAVELAGGGFLEGLELDSEEFEEWAREKRSQFSDRLTEALSKLMRAYEDLGDHESALAVGQKILRRDPFDEVALRAMMRLYAASGRRNQALQVYRAFAENLQKELGVEPEQDTQDAFRGLAEAAGTAAGDAAEVAAPPMRHVAEERQAPVAEPGATASPPPSAEADGDGGERDVPAPVGAPASRPRARIMALLRLPIWAFSGAATVALVALIVIGITFWRVPALGSVPINGIPFLGEM